MDANVKKVVMLPELYKLLRQYQRLSYNPWTAISEFIDNSTESWFQNKEILMKNGITGIQIDINYDKHLDRLTIKDSAYGMELEDFERAIILGAAPSKKTRNEYGFGLKTAACWFGDKWEVHSTQLNSSNKYSAIVDINEIEKTKTDSIDILYNEAELFEHYTEIIIHNVGHRMKDTKIKSKIIKNVASKYRRDIKNGNIKIFYNGEPIEFKEPIILVYKGERKIKNIDFTFEFKNKEYNVTGFVGIFAKNNDDPYAWSGFSLFTNDRTIIGGYKSNYTPSFIFTNDPKSTIRNKLFGELNLSNIPVNQAKDNYVWNDGLEEEFLKKLKENIRDYIDIASKTYKEIEEDEKEYTKTITETTGLNDRPKSDDSYSSLNDNRDMVVISKPDVSIENDYDNVYDSCDKSYTSNNKTYIMFKYSKDEKIYKVVCDNTITDIFQLDESKTNLKINPDNIHFKNTNDKRNYAKQCLSLALLFDDLKQIYKQVNITTVITDLKKRYLDIYYGLGDVDNGGIQSR